MQCINAHVTCSLVCACVFTPLQEALAIGGAMRSLRDIMPAYKVGQEGVG